MISYEYEERTWISSLCPPPNTSIKTWLLRRLPIKTCMVTFCDVVTSSCIYIRVCKDARSSSTRKTGGGFFASFTRNEGSIGTNQPTKETRQRHMPCRAPAWRHSEPVRKVGTPHATERTTEAGDCTGHAVYFFFCTPFFPSPRRNGSSPVQARPAHTAAPNRPAGAGACGPLGGPSEVAAACTADHNGR